MRGIFFLTMVCALAGCSEPNPQGEVSLEEIEIPVVEPTQRYNILVDQYEILEGTIEKNEFLSDILLPQDVDYGTIAALETASKDVHDVRRLKAGDDYAIFKAKDSLRTTTYFVVETTAVDYVVYQLTDSISAWRGQKPVEYKIREAGGIINSSLYQTIADNNMRTELAHKLNDIYAWTVDFYRIQKGDFFKVIYEEKYVDDQLVGIGRIMASEFQHRDELFVAYRFEQDSVVNYFDEKGESLRKAFLQAPLEFSRISSNYSLKRYHPVQKRWKAHLGTDYAAPKGTPIMATGDGTVIASAYGKYNGNYVKVKHNSTYTTQYLHMTRRAVKSGEFVRQGEVIGYVGSTGLATGPHVCYRFWKNGKQVDPYKQDLPPSEPVDEKYKLVFFGVRDSLQPKLNAILLTDDPA